jgi:predicted SAM-dependent methyltransferase
LEARREIGTLAAFPARRIPRPTPGARPGWEPTGGSGSAVPTRLQLGASRLEDLDARVLAAFLDDSWVHLGDAEGTEPARDFRQWLRLGLHQPLRVARLLLGEFGGRSQRPRRSELHPEDLYARTHFRAFYYEKGDELPFADACFDYVFSEHFLHHLFFDEGVALLRECHRVLKPWGVIRTVVPDADLRSYEAPEPVGYPDPRESFLSPLKHKTRYSVYMLSEALRFAGFEPIPLRYCDRSGAYVRRDPAELRDAYGPCPEKQLLFDLGHVTRIDSLIVDGSRRPA